MNLIKEGFYHDQSQTQRTLNVSPDRCQDSVNYKTRKARHYLTEEEAEARKAVRRRLRFRPWPLSPWKPTSEATRLPGAEL